MECCVLGQYIYKYIYTYLVTRVHITAQIGKVHAFSAVRYNVKRVLNLLSKIEVVVYIEKGHFSKKVMMFILNYKFEEIL